MAKAKVGEVVERGDVALVRSDSTVLQRFTAGLQAFLVKAADAEKSALARLEFAKSLRMPRSIAEDEAVQVFVKEAKAEKKTVGELWGICSSVDQFHKRLVGMRRRPEAALEESATIAIRLHDAYVEADRKRVREEEDRKRRAAELKAQQDRDAELAQLEAEAVKAEEGSLDLSERERTFVANYGAGADASKAAMIAGFAAERTKAIAAAARLLSKPKIIDAVKAWRTADAIRRQAEATKAQPLDVKEVEVKSRVSSTPGLRERKTYRADVFDLDVFIDAVLKGVIATDVIMPNQTKLNDEAGRIKDPVIFAQAFPGCRLVENKSNW